MKGEWCFVNNRLSKETCDRIIELGLTLPAQEAGLGVNNLNSYTNDSYRRSIIRFINRSDTRFEFLFDTLWKYAIQVNDTWFGFHISKLDYIQFAEYNETQKSEYKRHHDVFWINNDPGYHRKLSCTVQLSEPSDYTGADLQLHDLCHNHPNTEDIKKQGSILFFPSFLPHSVTPITQGTRYSLAAWFDGPKWR
jgi:PKHD-type hydroxylase